LIAAAIIAQQAAAPSTTSSPSLSDIERRGTVRGCYHVEPPSIIRTAAGQLDGAFIHAFEAVAAGLNVRPTFVEVPLSQFATALADGRCDVSLGPTFKTMGRARDVAFTDSLYFLGYTAVVPRGRGASFRTDSDVNRQGVRVAVREGSPIEEYVKRNYPLSTTIITTGDDLTLPLRAVAERRADVGFMNEHTVESYVAGRSDLEIIFAERPRQMGGMAWSVSRESQQLLNYLNTAIAILLTSGQMADLERASYGKPLRHDTRMP
jgi:ABC-type amino acid transport substrate-binding protein